MSRHRDDTVLAGFALAVIMFVVLLPFMLFSGEPDLVDALICAISGGKLCLNG